MKKTAVILILWMGICVSFTGQVLGGTEGLSNTLYGNNAGYSLDGNQAATFIGVFAGHYNTTGYNNTFLGNRAGLNNTGGCYNTFLGSYTGSANTIGHYNTFLGYTAGNSNITGHHNTFLGGYAGYANTTGHYNTFLGYTAGYNNTEGASNVFIGYKAGFNETGSNKLYIDNTETANPLIYGEFDNDLVRVRGTLEMVANVAWSDVRMKKNIQPLNASLNKVSMLEGVSFDWKTEEYADRGFSDDKQIGLIAQDVENVLPELVRTGSDGHKAIAYSQLTAVLVEAIKELKKENEALKDKLENQMKEQQAEINALKAILKDRAYSSLSSNSSICMAAGGAQ